MCPFNVCLIKKMHGSIMYISPKILKQILTGNVVIWRNGQSESIYYSSLHGLQAQLSISESNKFFSCLYLI